MKFEEMRDIFKSHSEQYIRNIREMCDYHMDTYKGSELPEHLKNYFDISEALYLMCEKIEEISNELNKGSHESR